MSAADKNNQEDISLNPDTPAEKNDLLNRTDFVKAIVDQIKYQDLTESGFTAALYGKWGEGKTSVLNFIRKELENETSEKVNQVEPGKEASEEKIAVEIVEFNPWMYHDPVILAQAFLKELYTVIEKSKGTCAYFVSLPVAPLIALVKILYKISLFSLDVYKSIFVDDELKQAVEALSISQLQHSSSAGLNLSHIPSLRLGLGKSVTGIKSPFSQERKKMKEILKKKVKEGLRILVMVDDLDRCLPEEILTTLRLIKAVCDFPGIFFLLSCDREKVAQAVGRELVKNTAFNAVLNMQQETQSGQTNGQGQKEVTAIAQQSAEAENFIRQKGDEYLKKLVQHEFLLPTVWEEVFSTSFIEKTEELLIEPKSYIKRDEKQEDKVFAILINAKILKNLRDVKRLSNALQFFVRLCDRKGVEINAADLIAIETLRLFYPKEHREIAENKWKYTQKRDLDQNTIDKDSDPSGIKRFLFPFLFPFLFSEYSELKNKIMFKYKEDESNFRLNTEKYFNNYFSYKRERIFNFDRLNKNYLDRKRFEAAQGLIGNFIQERGYTVFFEELAQYQEEHKSKEALFDKIKKMCELACNFHNLLPSGYWDNAKEPSVPKEKNTDIAQALWDVFGNEHKEDLRDVLMQAESLSLLAALFTEGTIITKNFSQLRDDVEKKIEKAINNDEDNRKKYNKFLNQLYLPEASLLYEAGFWNVMLFVKDIKVTYEAYIERFAGGIIAEEAKDADICLQRLALIFYLTIEPIQDPVKAFKEYFSEIFLKFTDEDKKKIRESENLKKVLKEGALFHHPAIPPDDREKLVSYIKDYIKEKLPSSAQHPNSLSGADESSDGAGAVGDNRAAITPSIGPEDSSGESVGGGGTTKAPSEIDAQTVGTMASGNQSTDPTASGDTSVRPSDGTVEQLSDESQEKT